MNSNEEIYLSYLCDRIMAVCDRLNKRFDMMDEQRRLFTYSDSYAPLQYPAPAYVTSWRPMTEPYFDNQPQLSSQQPPPNTFQSPPPLNTYQPLPPPSTCQQPTSNSHHTYTSRQPYELPQPHRHNPISVWCPQPTYQQQQLPKVRPPLTSWDTTNRCVAGLRLPAQPEPDPDPLYDLSTFSPPSTAASKSIGHQPSATACEAAAPPFGPSVSALPVCQQPQTQPFSATTSCPTVVPDTAPKEKENDFAEGRDKEVNKNCLELIGKEITVEAKENDFTVLPKGLRKIDETVVKCFVVEHKVATEIKSHGFEVERTILNIEELVKMESSMSHTMDILKKRGKLCTFDPGGNISAKQLMLEILFVVSWFPP